MMKLKPGPAIETGKEGDDISFEVLRKDFPGSWYAGIMRRGSVSDLEEELLILMAEGNWLSCFLPQTFRVVANCPKGKY